MIDSSETLMRKSNRVRAAVTQLADEYSAQGRLADVRDTLRKFNREATAETRARLYDIIMGVGGNAALTARP
jgi:hypothetical protein